MTAWPLSTPPPDYVIGHVRAVTPDRVVDDARVVVRGGRVAEVTRHPPGTGADGSTVDGGGLHLLPGIVDVHSDTLARDARPRPGVGLPPELALAGAQARLRACGVTTALHGVSFADRTAVGTAIASPYAEDLLGALDVAGAGVLHRLDVRSPTGREMLERRLATAPGGPLVVSHEDHTPGQGQYADPATMERWLVEAEGHSPEQATAHVAWWRTSRDELLGHREATLAWLGEQATAGRILLFGHDPVTADDVTALVARGGRVAEFPTTLAAAHAARDAGLEVVAGAPNVLRGRSHSGNVSARELAAAGLLTALASDYLPSAMLPAVTTLVEGGLLGLPAAVRLVTAGAADCVGVGDRGRLVPGARADLVLVDLGSAVPVVRAVLTVAEGSAPQI